MDIQKIRNETPGVQNVIHFNNAGASLMPQPVIDEMQHYFEHEYQYGGYETAFKFREELKDTYREIAKLIHAEDHEIAIMENATMAWQTAFLSVPLYENDEIITTTFEYASNYIPFLQMAKRFGVVIKVIPENQWGEIDVRQLEKLLTSNTKWVSIVHMPTANGIIQPIEEVGDILENHSAYYLLDACQSTGVYPLDVHELKCDFLSATGRKHLRGPRGTGFLYVKEAVYQKLEPNLLDLHGAEWISENEYQPVPNARRFENWEKNLIGKIGLKAAVQYANNVGVENIFNRVTDLASYFREELGKLPDVTVTDRGRKQSGIVTFYHQLVPSGKISDQLKKYNINVSVADKSGTYLDMNNRGLDDLIRASVHYYNTKSEIDEFIDRLKNINL